MITDPYKILNISPDASDDEVKKAYRELARKYHPDHYHGSPLEKMAEEKMKEINEAYAMIQQQRKSGGGSRSSGGSYGDYGNYAGNAHGYGQRDETDPLFQKIRATIGRGDFESAEQMLNDTDLRTAEWHFLMGYVYYHKGWLDEASREIEIAYTMDPNNMEYQQAYMFLRSGGAAYRPAGFGTGGMMGGNWCQTMICASMMCSVCSRGRCCLCC